jgi:hypothetical protein
MASGLSTAERLESRSYPGFENFRAGPLSARSVYPASLGLGSGSAQTLEILGTKDIGVTGFEPATYCSQSNRATKLRYTPNYLLGVYYFTLSRGLSKQDFQISAPRRHYEYFYKNYHSEHISIEIVFRNIRYQTVNER